MPKVRVPRIRVRRRSSPRVESSRASRDSLSRSLSSSNPARCGPDNPSQDILSPVSLSRGRVSPVSRTRDNSLSRGRIGHARALVRVPPLVLSQAPQRARVQRPPPGRAHPALRLSSRALRARACRVRARRVRTLNRIRALSRSRISSTRCRMLRTSRVTSSRGKVSPANSRARSRSRTSLSRVSTRPVNRSSSSSRTVLRIITFRTAVLLRVRTIRTSRTRISNTPSQTPRMRSTGSLRRQHPGSAIRRMQTVRLPSTSPRSRSARSLRLPPGGA